MKFGLENISKLCAALSHPERSFRSLLIAGTNGKGSVTAMVHRGLVAAGVPAARYTSPHLERLEERYVIGDREVDRRQLGAAIDRVREVAESLQRSGAVDTPPTFFECATAVAFELFREARVDVAVLEVGLGGRLDATNVVSPMVTAITSIGFDHQEQLGSSLESIAREKAGIVKAGVPLVCGDLPADAERVISAICVERGAPLIRSTDCASLERWIGSTPLALAGGHQRANAAVAACVLRAAGAAGVAGVADTAIRAGLTEVSWPGRLERFTYASAEVLLDAAHNPDGARALAAYLQESGWTDCALIFGALRDKAVAEMLAALAPACAAIICTTADSPRALAAHGIADLAARLDAAWTVSVLADPRQAIDTVTHAFRHVVVAGSIFLTGPVRGILRAR
jgi:dihydrofolate synthase/folylpolyglutamate synthase